MSKSYHILGLQKCFEMSKCWANLVLRLKSQSLLHVLSYPWATIVRSARYKILVCRRLTLHYVLPIVPILPKVGNF